MLTCLQNVCGISVVDNRFEKLKRYNLAEIFEPTAKNEGEEHQRIEGRRDIPAVEGTNDGLPEAS